ncbi:MAG: FAD:protein FMN transferase [Balneolaceae bacterium]
MSITTNRVRPRLPVNDPIKKNRQEIPGRFFHGRVLWGWFIVSVLFSSCSLFGTEQTHYADRVEPLMGTDIRIQLYASDAEEATRVLESSFDLLVSLENSWSHFDEQSELSRIHATYSPGEWVEMSEELAILVERGLQAWRWTDGKFDLTAGPLIELWRISRRTDRLPAEDALLEAMDRVGSEWIRFDADGRRIQFLKDEMRLDPGGIGKGLAADLVMEHLKEQGIEHALIDAGGDLLASAPPPGEMGWDVWLELPTSLKTEGVVEPIRLSLAHQAVATSGDLFQFVDIDGIRYSHIVDPSSGLGVEGLHQSTVIAPKAWLADLFATVAILEGTGIENRIPPEVDLEYLLLRKPLSSSDILRWESDGWRSWMHQGSR